MSFKAILLLVAIAFVGGSVSFYASLVGVASIAFSIFIPVTLPVLFPVGVASLLASYSTAASTAATAGVVVTLWHVLFAKKMYNTYKKNKIINSKGKTVNKVTERSKMEVDIDF